MCGRSNRIHCFFAHGLRAGKGLRRPEVATRGNGGSARPAAAAGAHSSGAGFFVVACITVSNQPAAPQQTTRRRAAECKAASWAQRRDAARAAHRSRSFHKPTVYVFITGIRCSNHESRPLALIVESPTHQNHPPEPSVMKGRGGAVSGAKSLMPDILHLLGLPAPVQSSSAPSSPYSHSHSSAFSCHSSPN